MSFEYDRFLMGTPSPRPSGGYQLVQSGEAPLLTLRL